MCFFSPRMFGEDGSNLRFAYVSNGFGKNHRTQFWKHLNRCLENGDPYTAFENQDHIGKKYPCSIGNTSPNGGFSSSRHVSFLGIHPWKLMAGTPTWWFADVFPFPRPNYFQVPALCFVGFDISLVVVLVLCVSPQIISNVAAFVCFSQGDLRCLVALFGCCSPRFWSFSLRISWPAGDLEVYGLFFFLLFIITVDFSIEVG